MANSPLTGGLVAASCLGARRPLATTRRRLYIIPLRYIVFSEPAPIPAIRLTLPARGP